MDKVTGCAAYKSYVLKPQDESSLARYLNPVGTDTGRLRQSETYHARGLALIDGNKPSAKGNKEVNIEVVDAAVVIFTGERVVGALSSYSSLTSKGASPRWKTSTRIRV